MNDASTTIPSHLPIITHLRPLVKDEDIEWIYNTYIHNVKAATSRYTIHCSNWARIVYHKLDYINDRCIIIGKNHTVCRVGKFYIDIFNNVILTGFDWEFEGFKKDSTLIYIDPKHSYGVFVLDKYYKEPAVEIINYSRSVKEFTVRQEDRDWMCSVYKHIIYPNRALKLLSCNNWDHILYNKLNYIEDREIQTGKIHTVLVAHGVYIDLECNAYLFNFDWKTQVWNKNIRVVPINEHFPIEYEYLSRFYEENATRVSKIHYYNKELG